MDWLVLQCLPLISSSINTHGAWLLHQQKNKDQKTGKKIKSVDPTLKLFGLNLA